LSSFVWVSQPHEKFLLEPRRKFRFDGGMADQQEGAGDVSKELGAAEGAARGRSLWLMSLADRNVSTDQQVE
jgi:hypothetical protein